MDLKADKNKLTPEKGAFTIKSILFGLLGVFIINFVSLYIYGFSETPFIGNHFPIAAFFFVVLIILVWNTVTGFFWRGFALRTKELTVVLSMCLVACWPPTSGLFRFFHRQIILPWTYLPSKPEWQKLGIMDYLPKKLFPLEGKLDDTVYAGFSNGMSNDKTEFLQLSEIPFEEWMPVVWSWAPMLIFLVVCVLSLSLLVHRQWAYHEQLSYPLASIATSIISREERNEDDEGNSTGEGKKKSSLLPPLFRNRLFWWGCIPVLLIYLINIVAKWYPNTMPSIALDWYIFGGLASLFRVVLDSGVWGLHMGTFYFTIVGITYFLSSEIGFSMGVAPILFCIFAAQYYLSEGTRIGGEDMAVFRGGAFFGYALILLYTGRTFYWAVITKAFLFGKPKEHEEESVFAARILIFAFIGLWISFSMMNIDWLIALIYSMALLLFFLVFTRIICETGIPFLATGFQPGVLLVKFLGPAAVGAGPLVMLYYLGSIITRGSRQCLMPYIATGLKVADDTNVKRKKLLGVLFVATLVALVVGYSATMRNVYSFGSQNDGIAHRVNPVTTINQALVHLDWLEDSGQISLAKEASGLEKLQLIALNPRFMRYALVGLVLVIGFSMIRFRYTWWPIHPVIFLMMQSKPLEMTFWSFLVGWAVKLLVVRFGGGKVYQNLKPFFIGLIFGELIAGGGMILHAYLYKEMTGLDPETIMILPKVIDE